MVLDIMEQVGQFIWDILLAFLEKLRIIFDAKINIQLLQERFFESECNNPERYCGWF